LFIGAALDQHLRIKVMKITKELLLSGKNRPCSPSLRLFVNLFPYGMDVTHENAQLAHEKGLSTDWFIPFCTPEYFQKWITDILSHSTNVMLKTALIHDENYANEEKRLISLRNSGEIDYGTLYQRVEIARQRLAESLNTNNEIYNKIMRFVDVEMVNAYMNDDGSIKEFEERIIVRSDLVTDKPYACTKQLEKFEKYFPNGFIVNEDNLQLANKLHFDIEWFISWKLEPKQISVIYQYYNMFLDQEDMLKDLLNRNRVFERTEQDEVFNASVRLATSFDERELRYNEHMDALDKIDAKYSAMLEKLVNNRFNTQNLFALRMINAYGLLK
jgi:predicted DNA-binding protein YlxM (UPF0122 family)